MPVGALCIRSLTSRRADTPSFSCSASPVSSDSLCSRSAAVELPDGTALSKRSFGRTTSSSASAPVW